MILNINTDELVKHTARLEKIHRSALPAAVRGALNDAVFDVKTNTMPKKADQTFEKRAPNFFKANSKFEKADGFNINAMKATVGFVDNKLQGSNNYSVRDLEEQEYGGSIDKKSFIPTVFARAGGSTKGLVRANARLSRIKKIIKSKNSDGKNKREKFVIAAAVAGKGGFVLHDGILFRIDTAPKSSLKTRGSTFNATPLYSFKEGRKAKVKQTKFMRTASEQTAQKMDMYYIKHAERQINKLR